MFRFAQVVVCCSLVLGSSFLFSESVADCGSMASVNADQYGHVDTKGLAALISSGSPVVILDARCGKWDDGKRIGSAQSLSYEATAQEAAEAIPALDSLVVVYCTNPHCPASMWLAAHLAELGYTNILKYGEGIEEWINSGFPVSETR